MSSSNDIFKDSDSENKNNTTALTDESKKGSSGIKESTSLFETEANKEKEGEGERDREGEIITVIDTKIINANFENTLLADKANKLEMISNENKSKEEGVLNKESLENNSITETKEVKIGLVDPDLNIEQKNRESNFNDIIVICQRNYYFNMNRIS
jgi:hypothetical protein